eukprot:Tbor_TRINITY_DN3640_c0_g1::TRINITY_DN3640_c0_g1_i2::g.307::m.307/K00382/DLD, lpd, pdhD; dihydrolipoamide dehydrogenase
MLRFTSMSFGAPRIITKSVNPLPHFDVCVIGAGPAGIASALRAVDYNKTVCLVEKGCIGGADLWNGALHSKMLWEMSKFATKIRNGGVRRFFGEKEKELKYKINEEKIRKSLVKGASFRENQLVQALQAAKVRVVNGSAMFASPTEVNVHDISTGEYNTVNADYFIIATGSAPRMHPHYQTNGTNIVTSEEIMMQDIPKSIVIIGAGVVGCEFACIYANFGMTKVHIIDKAPRILPMEDEDIALYVQNQLEKKGVTVHHNSSLFDLQDFIDDDGNHKVHYMIQCNKTQRHSSHIVDKALVCIGRLPNYKGLGLENTKCQVTDGKMQVDKFQRCIPHENIYAVGDATMDICLVNMGEIEGRNAIDNIYAMKKEESMGIVNNLSTIIFLDEEVAAVGLNEQQCRNQNVSYLMARYGYEFVSRAVAMGDIKGFVKIIVTNDKEKRVLGVRAVGQHASSVVELASTAIHNKQSAYDLSELMTAYPAITQGFQECLRMLLGRSVLKPNVFPQLVLGSWSPADSSRGRFYRKEHKGPHHTCEGPPAIPEGKLSDMDTTGVGSVVHDKK